MTQTLTHAFISKALPPKRYFDSTRGLHLLVKRNGLKYWVFRFTMDGRRHDFGLGAYPDIGLSEARVRALNARQSVLGGQNPLARSTPIVIPVLPTFSEFAEEFISSHEAQWENAKHIDQWRNTLRDYANPIIGKIPIDQIGTDHILQILSPIWSKKTETASRVRGRIERILGAATARGMRSGLNPAQWRGHLEHTLPPPKRIRKVEHYAALPYRQIHQIVTALRNKTCASAFALEFLILNASRTNEVRLAKWNEIHDGVWIIPMDRMKARKEHRVPLSARCLEILSIAKSVLGEAEYIFHRNGRPLSNVAMSKLLNGIATDFTVHGFRSTFRDWVAEETEHRQDVAEMALSHTIENAVEASYRRGDLLNRRRRLMEDWANYCGTLPPENLITIERRAA